MIPKNEKLSVKYHIPAVKKVPSQKLNSKQNIQMTSRIHISDCAKETEAVA